MALNNVPPESGLVDQQFLQIQGPNGILTGFQYDKQQRTLYFKDNQVIIPSFHGSTHIAEDPIPEATSDHRGLMSANDKVKLDTIVGTRVGVLGFMGAGFPDDGGWMQGDIIFAAGTEFISLERVGNVIRFTVDSPVPLNCACESCAQIFWVQDETDVQAVRPPTCGGKMPGINGYGELKIYAFPESTIFDPNNPSIKLNQKGRYPSLIFKRYENSVSPGLAEFECVLKRDANNTVQTEIGWAMTPGAAGVPEAVWFMGKDSDGNQIRFDLRAESSPGLLGTLLYKGHSLTSRMAVVVNYSSTILSTNQYKVRWWDTDNHKPVGDEFVATNVWHYENPENTSGGSQPQAQTLDVSIDLLPVGTLVEVSFFKAGEVAGVPINRHYFNKRPELSPRNLWTQVGAVRFGDLAQARVESTPDGGEADKNAGSSTTAIRDIEKSQWGMTGFDDPLMLFEDVNLAGTESARLNIAPIAVYDPTLPGLRVAGGGDAVTGNFSERPVTLWHRTSVRNSLLRVELGRPEESGTFPPIDVLLNAQIDSHDDLFLRAVGTGVVNSQNYLRVKGCHFKDLPPSGTVRVITPGTDYGVVYRYSRKVVWTSTPDDDLDSIVLLADYTTNSAFSGQPGAILELLHEEYNSPCLRIEFTPVDTQGMSVQFKVGELDMSTPYELDSPSDTDDYVRGLAPGYTVSQVYTQPEPYTGVGAAPSSTPYGFVLFDGGAQVGGDQAEYWNTLEVMQREDQVWVWWNGLLVPPSPTLSAALDTPVRVDTPYFSVSSDRSFGKVGLRMWPGAKVRSMELRSQARSFSEFSLGQLAVGR